MVYIALIAEFLKIGLFSVGGGLATLPFLYRLTDRYDWFTREMLVDMIAISESTPGPIGINMATYAGHSAGGVAGGVLATLAIIAPSVAIALIITKILDKFRENRYVKRAFYGIRPAVTALIATVAIGIMKITMLDIPAYEKTGAIADIFSYRQIALFFAVSCLMRKYKLHPVFYIGGAAAAGAILGL
ncbi:MAG: chromate transporter [Synergistaceae bacterium]|jgi:chromate transporter|nr:chromate transporter [Synergistaceae bacterium]